MQATAAVEATNVVAGDVSVKDSAGMIVSAGYDMPETISIDLAAVQQVTVMTDPAMNEDLTIYPTLASVADVIELNGPVTLTVDQAGLTLTGSGSYSVFDTADAIEGAVTDDSAGVLDSATTITAGDGVDLNLTVAEYKQIADGDTTLSSGYYISDTADNIEAEISADGSSLGVLSGAQSVTSTDEAITLTMAGADALLGSTTVATDYEVVDDASAFLPTPNMATLMGAVSITVEDATVDQAMGLVALQDMAGVDNLDFSIAGDESLSDLSVMQATAAVEATNVVAGDVSVKDFAGVIVSAG